MKEYAFIMIVMGFTAIIAAVTLYMVFVVGPVNMYADIQCKRAGYPVAHTTVNLESYCMNLDGSVTVKVDRLK